MPQSIGNHNYQVFARNSAGDYSQPVSINVNVGSCSSNNTWNHKFYLSDVGTGREFYNITVNGPSTSTGIASTQSLAPSNFAINAIFKDPTTQNNVILFGLGNFAGKIYSYVPSTLGLASAGSIVYPGVVAAVPSPANDFIALLTNNQIARISRVDQSTISNSNLSQPVLGSYPGISTDGSLLFVGNQNSSTASTGILRINTSTGQVTNVPFTGVPGGLPSYFVSRVFVISQTEGLAFADIDISSTGARMFRFNLTTGAITDTEIIGRLISATDGQNVVSSSTTVYIKTINGIFSYNLISNSLTTVKADAGSTGLLMLSSDNQFLFYSDFITTGPTAGGGYGLHRIDLLTGNTSQSAVIANGGGFRAGVAY